MDQSLAGTFFRAPLSGNVNQDYAANTSWFSPQLEFNFAGDKKIESQVVGNVASYGKQLSIITDVLLELTASNDSEFVERLRQLNYEVEQVKSKNQAESISTLKKQLMLIKKRQPDEFSALIKEVQG